MARRRTHFAHFVRCVRTDGDKSVHEARCARGCEVKTINISDKQITRDASRGVFDGSMYFELDAKFKQKLVDDVSMAIEQLSSWCGNGVVYLLVHPDDRSLDYMATYKRQVGDVLRRTFPAVEVIVKFGIHGRNHLMRRPAPRS